MDYENMGDLISDKRKAKSMTQKQLADLLNVTDKAVSKWERGVSCPDINTIPKLADILGVSVDELLRFQRQNKTHSQPIGQKISGMISLILKAVGLAMGVAVLVLSIMDGIEPTTAIKLLAIGLSCIGIAQLQTA